MVSIVFWTNERFTINLFSYVKNMQLFRHKGFKNYLNKKYIFRNNTLAMNRKKMKSDASTWDDAQDKMVYQ